MRPDHKTITLLVAVLAVALTATGCLKPKRKKMRTNGSGTENIVPVGPDEPGAPVAPVVPPAASQAGLSSKANVRFKPKDVMQADLEETLALSSSEICKELGEHDCIEKVHLVALGGTDPYKQGVFVPITQSTVTTPIAWERIVLSGCAERGRRDAATPASAALLTGLPNVEAATKALYRRSLKRDPTSDEVKALRGLYDQLQARGAGGSSDDVVTMWAQLGCYAVLSSVEYVFY